MPLHLIHDILILLPAKSLIRFKSVSKSWRSLLVERDFAASHVQKSIKIKTDFDLVLESVDYNHFPIPKKLTLAGMNDFRDYPFEKIFNEFVLRGSSNGLVCFTDFKSNVFLGNMLINDFHVVNVLSNRPLLEGETLRIAYGFGYDSIHDDYKVLRILSHSSCNMNGVEVYSLRYDRWSQIGDGSVPSVGLYGGLDPPNGVFVNSSLHWLAKASHFSIIAFDLSVEGFRVMPLPRDIQAKESLGNASCLTVGALGGCLCVTNSCNLGVSLWVLKDYMVESSWTQLFFVPQKSFFGAPSLKPLAFSSCGYKILFHDKSKDLCWYDSEKNAFEVLEDAKLHRLTAAEVFFSSLVSVSAYKATWQVEHHQGGISRAKRLLYSEKKDYSFTYQLPISAAT